MCCARRRPAGEPGGSPSPRRWSRSARRALRAPSARPALDTNVEFYTALLLEPLGSPRGPVHPVFAVGRVAGWVAHALEQETCGRIIRPQSNYVGPRP